MPTLNQKTINPKPTVVYEDVLCLQVGRRSGEGPGRRLERKRSRTKDLVEGLCGLRSGRNFFATGI